METGGPWGKYVCFFSTGINPKTREAQDKNRESKAAKIRQNSRNNKKQVILMLMTKPRKPVKEETAAKHR